MDEGLSPGLVLDIRVGESIILNPAGPDRRVVITIEAKSGQRVRARVQAEGGVPIETRRLQK